MYFASPTFFLTTYSSEGDLQHPEEPCQLELGGGGVRAADVIMIYSDDDTNDDDDRYPLGKMLSLLAPHEILPRLEPVLTSHLQVLL